MNKQEAIDTIENTFCHLIYDKDIKVGNTEVLLHFPTIGIAVLENSPTTNSDDDEKITNIVEALVSKELDAKPIYLDLDEKNFNIGYVINEILLESGFAPIEDLNIDEI